jgi:hypothetical protein
MFTKIAALVVEQGKKLVPDPTPHLLATLTDLQAFAKNITELSENSEPMSVIADFFISVRRWQDDRLSSLENDFQRANHADRYINIICGIQDVCRQIERTMTSGYVIWRPDAEMRSVAEAIRLGGVSGIPRKPLSACIKAETNAEIWVAISSQAKHFMQIHARLLGRSIEELAAVVARVH